jgi:hypothetical protein
MKAPSAIRPLLLLAVPAALAGVGCSGSDLAGSDEPTKMTLLARVERSPSHVISFYDSDFGIVIGETGTAEDAARHAPLDQLRSEGMAATFRALSADAYAEVPASLLNAEATWQAREQERMQRPAPVAAPPPLAPEHANAPAPALTQGILRQPNRVASPDGIETVRGALGGLPTDAAWWQSLPVCQFRNFGPASGGGNIPLNWVDAVWCVTDVGGATTGWVDSMYYEATAFGQGDFANVKINKWINGAWQTVISTTVAYRYYQTFSFPPENGAFYQTFVSGNQQRAVGIAERYRLAMPQPAFVNNKPSDVEYDFSNDLQGITHDANNWFLTRTKYGCVSIICTSFEAKYGLIAKVPLGTSLSSAPTGHGMPSSWNVSPGGGRRYNHFGDLVHVNGLVYVSMSGDAGGALGIYDTNLNPIAVATLSQNWSPGLVAYNPRDGLFYVPSDSKTFQKYDVVVSNLTATATWKGKLILNKSIPGAFQGSKFSPKGNLWLLTGIDSSNREFWGIDAANGAVLIKGGLAPGSADESEGLDIFDLDTEKRPGMAGQLHLQMLNNQVDDDNWWLMHWRAPMSRL